MATFPTYESQRNINAKTSQPLRNEVEQEYKADQEVLGAIKGIADTWVEANDTMEYTKAKADYEIGIAQIQAEAVNDPDFKNSGTYYKALEDLKNNSLEGIGNRKNRSIASMEMDYGNQTARIKIDTNFKQKQLVDNKFNLGQSIEALQQKKLQASTEAEAMQYDLQMESLLLSNIDSGTISRAEAEKMKNDANQASAEFDATVNPDKLLANNSKYYGIPEDEFIKLKETAMQTKERGEKEAEESLELLHQENETALTISLADNQIDRMSVASITQKMMNNEISRDFGEAYIRVLTSAKHIDKEKKIEKSGFTTFAKELFKTENPQEVRKALTNIFNKSAEGKLNQEQLSVLLKVADKEGGNKGWIGGAIDGLMKIGEARLNFSAERLVYDFFKNMLDGKEPEEAKEMAITNEQIKTNPNRTKYSIGDMVDTPIGPMYVWGYYEDGEPDVRKEKPKK